MAQEGDNTNDNNEEKKEEEIEIKNVVSVRLEIGRVQFFIIKNDERKELSKGQLKLVTNEPDHTELVFTFTDYADVTHTLSKSKRRPTIKMCDSDYIFMMDGRDSFGLYVDLKQNAQELLNKFEELLSEYSHFKVSSKKMPIHKYPINENLCVGPPDKVAIAGMKLAVLICQGTVYSAKGIRKGTLMGTNAIDKSKNYLKTKIKPNEVPAKLSATTQSRLTTAQIAGKAAVKVSGALVTGAIATVNALSNEASDVVSKTKFGQKVVSRSGPKTKAAKEIVKSTVAGVYTIYDEVISSGLHLVQETSHATADVIGHKYGDEAYRAAESTADVIDSAASTVVNLNMLGYKSLAKRIAANTTVELLSEEQEIQERRENQLKLNTMDAVKGFVIVNDLSERLEQKKVSSRKRRQEYVGIEGVTDSENNYKINRDNHSFIDNNEIGNNDFVGLVSSMSHSANVNGNSNNNNNNNGNYDMNIGNDRGNDAMNNYNYSLDMDDSSVSVSVPADPISIFEDETLDVD